MKGLNRRFVAAASLSSQQQLCQNLLLLLCQGCELNCVCENENQPFLLTQNAITEMFKHVIGFCALKCGDAINIAISLESPET